ncbi:hypothetical protein M413DRAFT_408395 [Hebeloma cylindrosporum]|uniref:CxC6 like cysteine cluster associated with KDZ domain-containing protein n=1 Tax=Hebeloma cylindrosporum TaxID=76867 RepID=A0A0C2YND1_HEBCY|nr:hypothetical protein M413DRAFT_408395 [Hebeloma cylindrosporum h7]
MYCSPISMNFPSSVPLSIEKLLKFYRLVRLAKPTIECAMLDRALPPQDLPPQIVNILSGAVQASPDIVQSYWQLIKDDIWRGQDDLASNASTDEIELYNMYALPQETSFIPTNPCRTLTNPRTHKATLFTLRNGSLPVYTTSLYCRGPGCNRRYYHNNFVHDASNTRVYYGGVPQFVQVAQHFFMESALLEFFATAKVFGWVSAMNCARIYNTTLSRCDAHIRNNSKAYAGSGYTIFNDGTPGIPAWQTSFQLEDVHVMNGFFLYSVLLDKGERQSILTVNHKEGSQRERLMAVLDERNKRMEGIGQEKYTHACDLCFIVFEDLNGQKMKMQAAVCDGTTIGFPCCAVHDCKLPLINHRRRFCAIHQHKDQQCAVVGCDSPIEDGFRTCLVKEHRALETAYFQKGKALFQLRARLHRAGITVPADSASTEAPVGDDEEVILESCDGKSEGGNRRLQAYFGRRRAHNQQLIMRPCGIILSRATFYGSEAVSAVNKFAKATFPSPESTPEYFIFDNNCKLDAHQRNINDEHFKDTAKPVDVFHFRSKHKESDTHCQRYCNPAAFPEIIKDGKWRFNSSICEQTNEWLGGYQAILRDMEATRFSFYLDEMIKRRNRYMELELQRKGHCPWSIPIGTLFP